MKCIKIFLITSLACFVITGFSQNIVSLGTYTDIDYKRSNRGPNRAHYSWLSLSLFGTDLAFGELDGKQRFGNYYGLSWNHKFKISEILSHGLGFGIHRQVHLLSEKGLTSELFYNSWEKGKLVYWGGNVNYFWRFNFDPNRGNTLGTYLDILMFWQYNPRQQAQLAGGGLTNNYFSCHLEERNAAGFEMRIGREAFSLYFRYKCLSMSCLHKIMAPLKELDLPRWSIGLNVGLGF